MRTLIRFFGIVGLLLASFLAVFFFVEAFHRRQTEAVLRAAEMARLETLTVAVAEVQNRSAAVLAALALIPIDSPALLVPAGVDVLGWVGLDGTHPLKIRWRDPALGAAPLAPVFAALAGEVLTSVHTDGPTVWYRWSDGTLIEVHRTAAPATGSGEIRWSARAWSPEDFERVGRLAGGRVRAMPAERVGLGLGLRAFDGQTVALLSLDPRPQLLEQLKLLGTYKLVVLLGFTVVVMIVVAFGLARSILRPLDLIGRSLEAQDVAPLQTLLASRAQFGQFAHLVKQTLVQQQDLRREIEERKRVESALRENQAELERSLRERARLGRDLHDGVIQSIYAAGLTLEGAAGLVHRDPAAAEQRLQAGVRALNGTIAEIRSFLRRSDEPAAPPVPLDVGLRQLVETIGRQEGLALSAEIDESAAQSLPVEEAAQVLLVARESISNALRHAAAAQVHLRFGPSEGALVLEIADDGRGFQPNRVPRGHGLDNLTRRAEELGGSLEIDSQPGSGTRVRLELPLRPPLNDRAPEPTVPQ
jgi:signal transduction histidine kinase